MQPEAERRTHARVYCGLPVQFEQDRGNVLDMADASIFIALPSPATSRVGQEGKVTIYDRNDVFEESAVVVRVTPRGIALVSLSADSIFLRLRDAYFGEISYVEYAHNEIRASLWGYVSADLFESFQKISKDVPRPCRYILDFQRVTDLAPSGLALLLQLSTAPQGRNDVQIINCSAKVTAILSSVAVPGTGIVINDQVNAVSESARRFMVTVEPNEIGDDRVTVLMPEVFDYDARVEFSRIYLGRSRKSEYVLDFAQTKHLAKSAFGTLLLMHQHVGPHVITDIKIVRCNANILKMFEDMKFRKFFYIDSE